MDKKNLNADKIKNLHLSTTIEELLEMQIISIRTYNGCKTNGYKTLGLLLSINRMDILKWKGCGRKVLSELTELIDAVENNKSLLQYDETQSNVDNNEIDEVYNQIRILENRLYAFEIVSSSFSYINSTNYAVSLKQLQTLLSCVSNYSDNIVKTESLITQLLDCLKAPAYSEIIKRKAKDLLLLGEDMSEVIGKITEVIIDSGIKEKSNSIIQNILECSYIKSKFPFLHSDEIDFCSTYKAKYSCLPDLYIIYKNLIRLEERQAKMICFRYGLYSNESVRTLEELAEIYSVTRERVRQLTDADGYALKNISPKGIVDENNYADIDFISEEDNFITDIIRNQNLSITPRQTVILIDLLSKRLGSSSLCKNGKTYLFAWDFWNRIDLKKLEYCLSEVVTSKRTTNIELSADEIIEKSGAFINCEKYGKTVIKSLLKNYIYDTRKVETLDGETYLWEQTHVSYDEILEIVSERDSIVTREEILDECENRFPGLKVGLLDIAQNPYLSAVGLRGYVPASERNRYFSSIGDCAEAILKEFSYPLPLSDLLNEINDRRFSTNENSLRSLLSRKEDGRFVRFEGDLWGLKSKTYREYRDKTIIPLKRKNFDERFGELKQFIALNQRMPTTSVNDDESSLCRWINNVTKGFIEVSEDQLQSLINLLDANKLLPQNQTEVRFQNNCKEYKRVVEFLGRRPSVSSRPQLCAWFNSSLKKDNLSENNRRAFTQLIEWLEDIGVFYE